MNDDFGFDPADTELAQRLGAAAPPAGDADAVLAELRPRLTRARRRRQAGFLAIGTAVVVLLAGLTFAAVDPGDGAKVRVPPATRPPSTVDAVPSPTTPTVPPTTGTVTTPTGPSTTAPTATTTPAPPTTLDDHGGNRGPGGGDDDPGSNSGSNSGSSGSGSSDDD